MERKALCLLGLRLWDLASEAPAHFCLDGPPFIQPNAQADRAIALAPADPPRLQFTQLLALEIRKIEVLKHDLNQFLHCDFRLIVVHARLIPRLPDSALLV